MEGGGVLLGGDQCQASPHTPNAAHAVVDEGGVGDDVVVSAFDNQPAPPQSDLPCRIHLLWQASGEMRGT